MQFQPTYKQEESDRGKTGVGIKSPVLLQKWWLRTPEKEAITAKNRFFAATSLFFLVYSNLILKRLL
jgi:hypothetical protein